MESIKFKLISYFVNTKALLSIMSHFAIINIENAFEYASTLNPMQGKYLIDRTQMQETIDFICSNKVKPIEELLITNSLKTGELVTIERTLTFKGVPDSLCALDKGIFKPAEFYIKFHEHNDRKAHGKLNPEHFTCNSASGKFTGKSFVYMFGLIEEVNENGIKIKPIVIADRVEDNNNAFSKGSSILFVHPESIDEFAKMKSLNYRNCDINEMKNYSENQVKHWIAEIINENNIPKDWGGENSDLYTLNLHYESKPLRAAFIFKGRSKFHKMEVNDLGKNGDQIVRLFNEPAEIYILQHCHYISTGVMHHMEAFASRYYNIKLFSIIDGIDTLRILKSYGKI